MLNFFIVLIIAISLSMDTFSLSIAYGTSGIDKKKMFILSIIVGVFHFLMPLLGNTIGSAILPKISINSNIFVGLIFILLSIEMFFENNKLIDLDNYLMFFLFALTVSLDSFSVGIGISLITDKYFLSYLIFSFVSFAFTFIGLNFGGYLNNRFNDKSKIIGAFILAFLGIIYIIK